MAGPSTLGGSRTPRVPDDVLLVEDEIVIAVDAEDMLRRLGVNSIRIVRTVDEALLAIGRRIPDFALLDVKLGRETSFPVAEQLHGLGVRFALITGYAGEETFRDRFGDIAIITKPYTLEMLNLGLARYAEP
jgi:DNA-binding NtrC family response regulator